MSAPHIIKDRLPSLCQKLSDMVEVWRSYNKNNFACFFYWDTVYCYALHIGRHFHVRHFQSTRSLAYDLSDTLK